jgi:DNA-binding HxlR family transcriptional regulator
MGRTDSKRYHVPFEATLDVIAGKWKTFILYLLHRQSMRTGELRRAIPDITQKMLTQQLRELEADGVIIRTAYKEAPPRVEYELSEFGQQLYPVLAPMCEWGKKYMEKLEQKK